MEVNNCLYHNQAHIEQMYSYLESVNEPYDEALDWAIQYHDVIYDSLPNKEERSAKLFLTYVSRWGDQGLGLDGVNRVVNLIHLTKNHALESQRDKCASAMIRADLSGLTDKTMVVCNYFKIMEESRTLYNITVEDFALINIDYMETLRNTAIANILVSNNDDMIFFSKVSNGITSVITLSKTILNM